MTEKHILAAMTYIDSAYIDAAQKRLGYLPEEREKKPRTLKRNLAVAAAIALACVLFFQTPVGAAAAEIVQEKVAQLIEILFPSRDILVTPEGVTDMIPHEAHGKEPNATTPGFAIYIDESRYTMTEEEGVYFIRPIDPAEDLPPCEIEIREVEGKTAETAAQETWDEMLGAWETISGIYRPLDPPCLMFDVMEGNAWDSPIEVHYFFENGHIGSYHIISRYFLEAAEGHGTRFAAMVNTFTIIAPQDASQYENEEDAIQGAMEQEAAYAHELIDVYLAEVEASMNMTQADMNENAQTRYELWDAVLNKVWDSLERTMDKDAFKVLKEEQLQWIDRKEARMDDAVAEVQGGSLSATVYYGAGAQITERRVYELLEYLTGERTVEDIPKETAPKELIPGQSTIDDVSLYYQETFPDRNLYANFRDFDGNGYGDLAVWYQGVYLGMYFMEENYVLSKEVLFEESASLYEYWYEGEDGMACQPNIIGIYELEDNDMVSIDTFYDISEGGILSLRESLKYDGNGADQKWFTIGDDDWVPITEEEYRERINSYHYSAENLKPIEDYYLR